MAAPPPARSSAWPMVAGVAIVAVAVVTYLIATHQRDTAPRATSAVAATPPPPAATPPPPSPTPTWTGGTELPPAWVERTVALDPDRLLVVGHAVAAASQEAGLEAARKEAIGRVVDRLYDDLGATPLANYVGARLARDPALADRVVERYLRRHGATAAPDRIDVTLRTATGGVDVYARYAVPLPAYQAALEDYRASEEFAGATVTPVFPLLAYVSADPGDLIVIAVERRSLAERAGIRPGDVVVAIGSTPVDSIATLRAALRAARRPGATLRLTTRAGGAERTAAIQRPLPHTR
jgi:hypothetical protein